MILTPSPLFADSLKRVPPRPPALQDARYLSEYDDRTIFYDVFRVGSRRVLAVGPPAENLAAGIRASSVYAAHAARGEGAFTIDEGLDRVGRFWAWAPAPRFGPHRVRSPLSKEGVAVVGGDIARLLDGRRALMTLSKDNRLEWITFWAQWHVQRHGVDALIIYDNGSTTYSTRELLEAISHVPGISVAVVVEWNFPYGPLGEYWDSNYCQHGALEHARWRLLRRAAGFLNADVDELVADLEGRSVFASAALSATGVVALPSVDVLPAPGSSIRPPRFADQYHVGRPPSWVERSKWCVVPTRLPRFAQAATHEVTGVAPVTLPVHRIWHCRAITTYQPRLCADAQPSEIEPNLKGRLDGSIPYVPDFPVKERPLRNLRVRLTATCGYQIERLRKRVRHGIRKFLATR